MSYSFWDGIGDFLSGGGTSLVRYATGKDAVSQADPLHLFTDSKSDKLAKKTFDAQQYWNLANYNEQKRQYDENLKFQLDAYNYQRELNAMQMEREDTAVQRRIADLQASGLSPTLAAGSAASSTPVHASNVPQGIPAQMQLPSDIRVQQAMFKEGLLKDQMQLAMSVLGNIADVSRTKAETELIKAQKGHQDIINKYEDDMLSEKVESVRLENITKRMANSFNQLANPARLEEMRLGIALAKKQIDLAQLDKEIKTNEKLRQIYYNAEAKFKAALAGKEVELAELRKENIDWDTCLKIYALEYAIDNDVPLSGNLSMFGAVAGAASNLWHIFHK